MCGIVGAVALRPIAEILIYGLKSLEQLTVLKNIEKCVNIHLL